MKAEDLKKTDEKNTGIVRGICISEKKGTQKHTVDQVLLRENWGIEGDAHAGTWHRQISLLSLDKIDAFRAKGADVAFGAFGENLIVEGFDFRSLPVGTLFRVGEVLLEMTQIGKECHSHCEIFKKMGDCIMPREGVFAKVLHGGTIKTGDVMTMTPPAEDRPFTAAVITVSDKGSKGEREDLSGPCCVEILEKAGYEIVETMIVPDSRPVLKNQMIRLADQRQINLIVTNGGTGFSKRDVTPEATMEVMTKNAPGIAEAMRMESMKYTDRAMLSRAASVIRGDTLIVNLPGSPKAVRESLEFIIGPLRHGIEILTGRSGECARQD